MGQVRDSDSIDWSLYPIWNIVIRFTYLFYTSSAFDFTLGKDGLGLNIPSLHIKHVFLPESQSYDVTKTWW